MKPGREMTDRYMDAVGVAPVDFDTLVAVMAYQRVNDGDGVTRQVLAKLLETRSVHVTWLLRNHWLEGDTCVAGPKQILKATSRAWNNLWPWRMGQPPQEEARQSA
jgi:hypothetical protein